MLQGPYLVAKIGFDTAENEPAKNLQNLQISSNLANSKFGKCCQIGSLVRHLLDEVGVVGAHAGLARLVVEVPDPQPQVLVQIPLREHLVEQVEPKE